MTTYGRTNAVTAGGGTPTPTQTKEVQATAFPTVVTPDEGYALSQATVTAPANLSAENIKKDVTIAGVTGSFEGTVVQDDKFTQLVTGTLTEITADDLNGVTKLIQSAFAYQRNLISVVMPDTITELGESVFDGCSRLKSIILSPNITNIPKSFVYTSSIESITIPSGVTTIGQLSFGYCHYLDDITIPENVTLIDMMAFYSSGLTKITMLPSTPPTLGSNAFNGISNNVVITVPKGSLEAYRTATNWVQWADHMVEATA